MTHELLGKHKVSSEWLTPESIWHRVCYTLQYQEYELFDPCPPGGEGGLEKDWNQDCPIYVNPPSPAAPWAQKALETVRDNPHNNIIFACYSEAVLWQVNPLMDYPICWVRNRINWLDGNDNMRDRDSKTFVTNPNYLKPAKSPRNYNAFVCLSTNRYTVRRFADAFGDLGSVRTSSTLLP